MPAGKAFIETIPKGTFGKMQSGAIVGFGFGEGRFSIGGFTNELTKWGKGVGAIRNTVYHYVPSGAKAGTGRLSAGMAQAGKLWVQGGMRSRKLRSVRYEGPAFEESHNEAYAEWKQKVGFGDLVLHLTGSMAGAFGVKKSSHGGFELGILEDRYTNSPRVANLGPGHKDSPPVYGVVYNKKKVRIAEYAMAHEFGTDVLPPRPLITGLIAGYLHQVDPEWAELFKEMMYQAYWNVEQEPTGQVSLSGEGTQVGGGSVSNSDTGASLQIKSALYNIAKLVDDAALSLNGVDRLLQWTSDKAPEAKLSLMSQAEIIGIVAKILGSRTAFTPEDIRKIAHSVIYGTYEDINPKYRKK